MSDPSPSAPPAAPQPEDEAPTEADAHYPLYVAVRNALFALPAYFRTDLNISGVPATDLQNFNTSLGATIESQAVETLNEMRSVWDAEGRYAEYSFVRQAQRFPDVILRAASPDTEPQILMGIELKGWYVLAKEGEPSYRFKVTPAVCAPQDLLVVYPWALTHVISGSPRLFPPYVTYARYAARYRNYHWQYLKSVRGDANRESGREIIRLSGVTRNYPSKADEITDKPVSDAGNNFGRFARTGLMDEYMRGLFREKLSGIPLEAWAKFLALFNEDRAEEQVLKGLDAMAQEVARGRLPLSDETIEVVRSYLGRIVEALAPAEPSPVPVARQPTHRRSPAYPDADAPEGP